MRCSDCRRYKTNECYANPIAEDWDGAESYSCFVPRAEQSSLGTMTSCAYHPEREAVGVCVNCGRLICPECKIALGEKLYCNPCADKMFTRKAETSVLGAENTSGQGSLAVIPQEIRGWNWGAFILTWLWGISNKVWISLLSAIPYVGVIMAIMLGVKGNEWAWRNKRWDSIQHFKSTQKKWSIAGVVILAIGLAIGISAILLNTCAAPSTIPPLLEPSKSAPDSAPPTSLTPSPEPTPIPKNNNSQYNIDDDYYLSIVETTSGYASAADGELIVLINNREAKDPTYNELIKFIKRDWTDSEIYLGSGISGFFYGDLWGSIELDYYKDWIEFGTKTPEAIFYSRYPVNHPDRKRIVMICGDFAEVLHNNAELFGIKAAWVALDFKEGPGHALNAFQTTDRGLVFIDSTGQSFEDSWKISYGKPDSWDKVAYVEIGKEYGLVAIDKAEPYSYSFYEEFKQKWLECEELLSEYDEEIMRYNQEIEGKVYQEGSPELDRIIAWEARLNERSQKLAELHEELGDSWFEPLGIVTDIQVFWDGKATTPTLTPSQTPTPTVTPTPSSPAPVAPARFVLSELTITPTVVKSGEVVTVSIEVSNTGGSEGSYTVVFKVRKDWTTWENVEVTLKPGQTKTVTFTTKGQSRRDMSGLFKIVPGTYEVDVNGKVGQFTVAA